MLTEQENSTAATSRRIPLPDRILLTGFRATGKSTVGAMLAGRLGMDFIDTDARLCAELGCSVSEYVSQEGWSAFRQREKELLVKLAGITHAVISTGGGAVLHEGQWGRLRKNSLVVWLQADIATIHQRMQQDAATADQRPSLTGNGIGDEVEELLTTRSPLYLEGSDMSVDTTALTPEEIVNVIEEKIFSEG